ncbi:MAG TPA: zinc-finger domain-containing protein [Alphaproteobacteria bacterium]|nr:zinc-finger domain-containing protein [Alphaproteobacteria bacterium]
MVQAPAAPEIIEVETTEVSCDGGEGPLGHPRVFLNMGDKGQVECPYCDRLFKLKNGAAASGEH